MDNARIAGVLLALLLAGCAQVSPATSGATLPPLRTRTTQPTAPRPSAVVATAASVATSLSAPTRVPTTAPITAPPATSLPEPTAAPTSVGPATAPPESTAAPTSVAPTPAPSAGSGGEILFLRRSALLAFNPATRAERQIASDVVSVVASADGARLALVRRGPNLDIWTVGRDGGALRQVTSDARAESSVSLAADGSLLVFASSQLADAPPSDWVGWATWCAGSEVRTLDLASGTVATIDRGCDPALSPDGRRIAYASPPTRTGDGQDVATDINAMRLVNRLGKNGWSIAATGAPQIAPSDGLVVYGPAWTPDSQRLLFSRFVGMQVETDVNRVELTSSFDRTAKTLAQGAGWLLPARVSPDGKLLAITEHNLGDARGWGGWDTWSVAVYAVAGSRTEAMPSGDVAMVGTARGGLSRAQAAVWSPDGRALAALLPPGWRADLPSDEPFDASGAEHPGEIWRWRPGGQPEQKLVGDVDFASPVLWLP